MVVSRETRVGADQAQVDSLQVRRRQKRFQTRHAKRSAAHCPQLFRPEELWTVRGAPFGVAGLEPFLATTNLQGVNLRLVSTNASFTGNNHPVLEVSFTPPREELRVSFVAATNEQGQVITNIGTAY